MFWSLDLDDFGGLFCDQGRSPLIQTVRDELLPPNFQQLQQQQQQHRPPINQQSNGQFDFQLAPSNQMNQLAPGGMMMKPPSGFMSQTQNQNLGPQAPRPPPNKPPSTIQHRPPGKNHQQQHAPPHKKQPHHPQVPHHPPPSLPLLPNRPQPPIAPPLMPPNHHLKSGNTDAQLTSTAVAAAAGTEVNIVEKEPKVKLGLIGGPFKCPRDGLFPNLLDDCRSFYSCAFVGTLYETAKLMKCPDGIFFDESKQRCEWNANESCAF